MKKTAPQSNSNSLNCNKNRAEKIPETTQSCIPQGSAEQINAEKTTERIDMKTRKIQFIFHIVHVHIQTKNGVSCKTINRT